VEQSSKETKSRNPGSFDDPFKQKVTNLDSLASVKYEIQI
jgi:hypothetical protein